jgi:hypothetical protein
LDVVIHQDENFPFATLATSELRRLERFAPPLPAGALPSFSGVKKWPLWLFGGRRGNWDGHFPLWQPRMLAASPDIENLQIWNWSVALTFVTSRGASTSQNHPGVASTSEN